MKYKKYEHIVYNCGYQPGIMKAGVSTGNKYIFRKGCVTKVDEKDGMGFRNMTYENVQWCDSFDKNIPPFITAEEWCKCSNDRYPNGKCEKIKIDLFIKEFSAEKVISKDKENRKKKLFSQCCGGRRK